MKKWISTLTAATLALNIVLPVHIVSANDKELIYLDQFEEFAIDDYTGMMTTIADLTYKLSFDEKGNICANTTKFKNIPLESTEELAEAFQKMMSNISQVCWDKVITVNAGKYGPEFSNYGYGKILEWYRDVNWEAVNNPLPEEKKKPQEEEKEEVEAQPEVEPEILPEQPEEEKEEPKEEILIEEETKEEEKPEEDEKEEVEVQPEVEPEILPEQPEEEKEEPKEEILIEEETKEEEKPEEDVIEDTAEDEIDDFILSDKELEDIVNNEIVEDPEGDTDQDGITNEDEVEAGTDPEEADSDFDGVIDSEDVNPTNPDSDGDLIPDAKDPAPLDDDANDNGINDRAEEVYDLEGVNAATGRQDNDQNGVPDVIDEALEDEGIDIENSYEDSDGDGASDALEAVLGTGPSEGNNVNDTYTDAESIIGYKDIRRPSRPNAIIRNNVKAHLASPQDGDITTDQTLFFQGNAPEGATVKFFYKDPKSGIARVFGAAKAQARNKFVGEARELPYGTYEIFTRTYNNLGKEIDRTSKVTVTIAQTIPGVEKAATEEPTIIGLNDKQGVTEAGKKLILRAGERTVAKGYTKPGNIVIAEWQSLILSSAVIADQDGYYEIATPAEGLEANEDHTLWLYSVDPETQVQSENAKVEFTIGEATTAAITNLDAGGTKNLAIVIVVALLFGAAGLAVLRRKKTPTPPATPMGQ